MVRNATGVLVLAFLFLHLPSWGQKPTITSFSPVSGRMGDKVVINGSNFSATLSGNIVYFGGVRAEVVQASSIKLTVLVPGGVAAEPISVLRVSSGLVGKSRLPFILRFLPKRSFGADALAEKVAFTVGQHSQHLKVADFDSDGRIDVAVANQASDNFSILRNRSQGVVDENLFDPKVDFGTNDLPTNIEAGDFDGDGKWDVAVSHLNVSANVVKIYRNVTNSGSVAFGPVLDQMAGGGQQSIKADDLDGDGKLDLSLSHSGSTRYVFRNGTTFGASEFFFESGSAISFGSGGNHAVGDVDGDGKPDLVATLQSSDLVSVRRNVSTAGASITNASFASVVNFTTGDSPFAVALADIDGDQKLDILVLNRSGGTVSVLRNTSAFGSVTTGSFAAKVDFSVGFNPFDLAIGDLNGDGKADLAVSNSTGVAVLINTSVSGVISTDSFAAKVDFPTDYLAQGVAIADFDSDGVSDLAVAIRNRSAIWVFRNLLAIPRVHDLSAWSGAIGDVVAIYGSDFSSEISGNAVYFGKARAAVLSAAANELVVEVPAGATTDHISVITDGLTAISPAQYHVTFESNRVFNSATFASGVDFETLEVSSHIALGDIDLDGRQDVLVTNPANNSFSIFRNISARGSVDMNSFQSRVDFTTGLSPGPLRIEDIDGDGKLDVAVLNTGANTISLFRNTSAAGTVNSGSFAAKVDMEVSADDFDFVVGDIDFNGKPDIHSISNSTATTLKNQSTPGNISFGQKEAGASSRTTSVGITPLHRRDSYALLKGWYDTDYIAWVNGMSVGAGYPATLFGCDLNGDQLNEVVAGLFAFGPANIAVMRASGDDGFDQVQSITSSMMDKVVAEDVDGDGKPDVVGRQTNGFEILKNRSAGTITMDEGVQWLHENSDIQIADIDGDGRVDVVLLSSSGNSFSVMRNVLAAAEPEGHASTFAAATASSVEIVLEFSAASTINHASGYLILRRDDGAIPTVAGVSDQVRPEDIALPPGTFLVGFTDALTTTFSDTDVAPGTTYTYALVPYNLYAEDEATYNYKTDGIAASASASTLAVEPSTQASAIVFPSSLENSMTLNYTRGNGTAVLVLARENEPVDIAPEDATAYVVDNKFGDGSELGVGNYVVAEGDGPVIVSGLQSNTEYHFAVFEYSGSGATINYNSTLTASNSEARSTLVNQPLIQAGGIHFENIRENALTVHWTNGDGSQRLLLCKAEAPISQFPSDGASYGSDLDFRAAPDIGDGHKVVYHGSGFSAEVTGLEPNTIYHFRVFELNGGGERTNYLTVDNNANPLSRITLAPEPLSQPTNIQFGNITQSSMTVIFEPAPGPPAGYIALRRTGSALVDPPADAIEYSVGQDVGSSTVVYVGAAATFDDTGLNSGTTYHYGIYAYNGSTDTYNYLATSPLVGNNQTTLPGEFKINPPSFDSKFSDAAKISVEVVGARGPLQVTMHSRPITGEDFSPYIASSKLGTASVFEVAVTSDMVDELGMEFYFTADDGIGNVQNPSRYFIYETINASAQAIPFSSGFNGKTASYKMFSIPYETDDKTIAGIFNEMGIYNRSEWRLFRYDGAAARYLEYQSGLANTIALGNGYWFNAKDDLSEPVRVGSGMVAQANQSDPYVMTLTAGWNQIGNPYPFNLDWNAVIGGNDKVGQLWFFNNGSYSKSNIFKPWTGAFVHADEATTLPFPVTAKTTASGRKSDHHLRPDLDAAEWLLPLTLRIDALQQISGIGMHPEAKTSKDRFDEITIPRFLDYAEMNTYHEEFFSPHFSTDVVPAEDEHVWLFEVKSNLEGAHGELRWDASFIASNKSSLMFIDLLDEKWVDMKTTGQYSFTHKTGRAFKIIYNREGEIKPGMTLLGEAYPNPFTLEVRIPLLIDEPGLKEIEIYDSFGRLIQRIRADFPEPGMQEMIWDTRDVKGQEISSGLFYYRLLKGHAYNVKRLIKK